MAAPGADTSKIRFSIEGPAETAANPRGDILIKTAAGVVVMRKPRIYQTAADGSRTPIDGSFELSRHGSVASGVIHREVGLKLASYDRKRALVIDPAVPIMPYSTFIGGGGQSQAKLNLEQFSNVTDNAKLSMSDVGLDVALDPNDKAYLTGTAFSTDFPTRNAFQGSLSGFNAKPNQNPNAFVSKFDYTLSGDASLIYSTYYGGSGDHTTAGHGNGDLAFGIAVDKDGQAYIVGQTYSSDLNGRLSCGSFGQTKASAPGSTNVGFIAKLGATGGTLVYACYIDGDDNATEARIALYPLGCGGTSCKAYIAGSTQSTNLEHFPVTKANAFQTDLATGTGGKSNATFIVVHEDGQSLDYATYYGGTGNGSNADSGLGITVDANGLGYMTGRTFSSDLMTQNAAFTSYKGGTNKTSDVFVAIFDPSLIGTPSLKYATYLGGSGQTASVLAGAFTLSVGDVGDAIALDANGKVWVAGLAASTDFQNTPRYGGTGLPVDQPCQHRCGSTRDRRVRHPDRHQPGRLRSNSLFDLLRWRRIQYTRPGESDVGHRLRRRHPRSSDRQRQNLYRRWHHQCLGARSQHDVLPVERQHLGLQQLAVSHREPDLWHQDQQEYQHHRPANRLGCRARSDRQELWY